MYLSTFLPLIGAFSLSFALNFPPVSGNKKPGVTPLELKLSYPDPITPSAGNRDLMISVYYPSQPSRISTLAPAYDSAYAKYLTASLGIPPGLIETVISNAYGGAKISDQVGERGEKVKEVLLFSGGYGQSREDYGATIARLVSRGYIIVSVDHPFDSNFVAYPDGHNATLVPSQPVDPIAAANSAIDIRVKDLQAVTAALREKSFVKQIPGANNKLDKPSGIFGHSFGGAAAASLMSQNKELKCGINLDGTFWGNVPVISASLSPRPFLTLASDGHNAVTDPSWALFRASGGRKARQGFFGITGSSHPAYTDFAYLYGILKKSGIPGVPDLGNTFGTIDGARMLEVEGTLLERFFERCFEGEDDPFKGLGKGLAEVVAQ
ncbi:hypothetical protein HYFRA_00013793 [Hymenoscyphus fraxineus]|uniref:1-alkyl-2-acetylglycerophosphocholine esterase n=1 Tax=Hymenoscyphus fraxineus TaxID=746836 RepID=A0A9N9LD77_9HELO|nr:hypothetical protein HYFRA_00013793 [Hymenoscyphus fraxineus]